MSELQQRAYTRRGLAGHSGGSVATRLPLHGRLINEPGVAGRLRCYIEGCCNGNIDKLTDTRGIPVEQGGQD